MKYFRESELFIWQGEILRISKRELPVALAHYYNDACLAWVKRCTGWEKKFSLVHIHNVVSSAYFAFHTCRPQY